MNKIIAINNNLLYNKNTRAKLIEEQKQGAEIILWTNDIDTKITKTIKICSKEGLIINEINRNVESIRTKYNNDTRKVYADIYYDTKYITVTVGQEIKEAPIYTPVVAVDFDQCLATTKSMAIISINQLMVDRIHMHQSRGDKVILWTCRDDNDLLVAVRFCRDNGIIFDAINCNVAPSDTNRKVNADLFYDDKITSI